MTKKVKIKELPPKIKIINEKKRSSSLEGEVETGEAEELGNFVSSDSLSVVSSESTSPVVHSSSDSAREIQQEVESSSTLRDKTADAPFAYSSQRERTSDRDSRTYSEPPTPSLSPVFHPPESNIRRAVNDRFSPQSIDSSSAQDFREEADRFVKEYEEKKKKRYPWQG